MFDGWKFTGSVIAFRGWAGEVGSDLPSLWASESSILSPLDFHPLTAGHPCRDRTGSKPLVT